MGVAWEIAEGARDLLRTPRADVMETQNEIRVLLELSGMRPDHIEGGTGTGTWRAEAQADGAG
jgi:hypothetical protein